MIQPNEDGDDFGLVLLIKEKGGRPEEKTIVELDKSLNKRVPDAKVQGERSTVWGVTDYMQALINLATAMDLSLEKCAQRFGTLSLPASTNGWCFHPALGFTKDRS